MKKNLAKQIIINKSSNLFKTNCFFNISMQEFANYLDVQKSLLFYYFKSKTNLYIEIINNYFFTLHKKFTIIFNAKISTIAKLEKLGNIYLKELENENFLNLINFDEKLDKSIVLLLNNVQKEIISYFTQTIEEGIKKGEIKKQNATHTSLAMLGYLEKSKQHNIKLKKNWFDFLLK